MTDAYVNRVATAVPGFDMVLSGRVPSTIAAVAVITAAAFFRCVDKGTPVASENAERLEADKGCRLSCYPPKVHDDAQVLRCLIGDVTYRNNKLRA
jgi:hypothetical protein